MPEPLPTNDPPVFMRDYRIAVDPQWRVTVPSAWRFAQRAELFIRVKKNHLVVMPRSEVERFRAKADELDGTNRTALLAAWARTTDQTKIDSAGRITLPKDWAQQVGIKTGAKVVMAGVTENFQIWAADQYDNDEGGMQALGDALLDQYD